MTENAASIGGGIIATLFGKVSGLIHFSLASIMTSTLGWKELVNALILAAIGGVGGYVAKEVCKYFWIKAKKILSKKK